MRIKKHLSILLVFAILLGIIPMQVFAISGNWTDAGIYNETWLTDQTNNGDSESTPYIITTAKDLADLAVEVNNGNSFDGKYIEIDANATEIDLSAYFWTPIGIPTKPFSGTFDGNNKLITGLKIGTASVPDSSLKYVGLFGRVGDSSDTNFTGKPFGTVQNLGVEVAIYSTQTVCYIGGLAGVAMNAAILNCYSYGTVQGGDGAEVYAGGLVGFFTNGAWVYSTYAVESSFSSAAVTVGSNATVGGLAGYLARAHIDKSYAMGDVTGGDASRVGGLVGYATSNNGDSYIRNCYSTGKVTTGATGTDTTDPLFPNIVVKHYACAGGLIGTIQGASIRNSYAKGNVIGGDAANIGGVAGSAPEGYYACVLNCYSTGNLTGGVNSNIGGILGYFANTSFWLTNCFWNSDASQIISSSNQEPKKGIGLNVNSAETEGVESRTLSQMNQSASFVSTFNEWAVDCFLGWSVDEDPYFARKYPVYMNWESLGNNTPVLDLDSSPTSSKWMDYIDTDWLTGGTNATANGSAGNPYRIESKSQFAAFAAAVNEGNDFSSKTIKIANDIDLDDHLWVPIGTESAPFRGIFEGNNYSIEGVLIGIESAPNDSISNVGLFGYIDGGTVKNVGADVKVYSSKADASIGGLVGISDGGIIQNSYVTGNINGINASKVGGLVGYSLNNGKVQNSCATDSVSGGDSADIGGLVGYNQSGTIQNSYAAGTVSGGSNSDVGGVVGDLALDQLTFAYWNTDAITTGIGRNIVPGATATGKTATELKSDDFLNTLNTNDIGVTEYYRWRTDSQSINNGFPLPTTNQSCTISFDLNGGTGTAPANISVEPDEDFTFQVSTTGIIPREGKTISGWSTENDGSGDIYLNGETHYISGNLTLYAMYSSITWQDEGNYDATL